VKPHGHVGRNWRWIALVVTGVVLAVSTGLGTYLFTSRGAGPAGGGSAKAVAPTPTPQPTPEPDARFTIVAGGDVLPHIPVLTSARTASGYDFTPLLAGVDPWISGADLALCNMEVPVAPSGTAPTGYPMFGTVPEVVRDLRKQGWNGCSTASNHTVDRGLAGLEATITTFDAHGLGHVGSARTADEATPQVYRLERAGRTFTIAHLAMTYSTNGLTIPHPWSVSLIDTDKVIAQATQARADGADMVLVSLHCCVEYITAASAQQVQVATKLAESGVVDLIIGHHAHVPQPIEMLPGGPHGDGMWVAYGLGNFVSNQSGRSASAQLLVVEVTATGADPGAGLEAGPPVVTSVGYVPITVDLRGHKVYALTQIPGGTAGLSAAQVASRLREVADAAGPQVSVVTTPPTPTGEPPQVVVRRVS